MTRMTMEVASGKNILFIINPIAGNGRGGRCVKQIGENLDGTRFIPEYAFTQYGGHAIELAREAASRGVDIVVAVGGDGTVNETACGLVGTQTSLGIIPCGSGDGLALHLGIPRTVAGAVEVINAGKAVLADSGIVEGHRFFCTAGVGLDAKVAYDYLKAGSRGLKTYISKVLENWRSFQPSHYIIGTENSSLEVEAMLVTVGNANQWGNHVHITPTASLTDGIFDITIVKPISLLQVPHLLVRLLRYNAYDSEHTVHLRGKQITIQRDGDLEAHYDGEALVLPETIHIECCPGSLYIWR